MATETKSDGVVAGMGTQQLLVVGGSVLALVAIALPWATVSFMDQSSSVAGYELLTEGVGEEGGSLLFNGGVTAVLSLIAIGLAVGRAWDGTTDIAAIVLGVLIAFVGAMFVISPSVALGVGGGMAGQMIDSLVDPGIGIYLTIVGGLAVLAGGATGYAN